MMCVHLIQNNPDFCSKMQDVCMKLITTLFEVKKPFIPSKHTLQNGIHSPTVLFLCDHQQKEKAV